MIKIITTFLLIHNICFCQTFLFTDSSGNKILKKYRQIRTKDEYLMNDDTFKFKVFHNIDTSKDIIISEQGSFGDLKHYFNFLIKDSTKHFEFKFTCNIYIENDKGLLVRYYYKINDDNKKFSFDSIIDPLPSMAFFDWPYIDKTKFDSIKSKSGVVLFNYSEIEDITIVGYYDTSKYTKTEIENIQKLCSFPFSKHYSFDNAIENNSSFKSYKNYSTFKKDSIYFSNITFNSNLWANKRDTIIQMLKNISERVESGLKEIENPQLIKTYNNADTCKKIVLILKSNDPAQRFLLWIMQWGDFSSDRLHSLGIKELKYNEIEKIDKWLKYDIYSYVFWDNCSKYYEYLEDYEIDNLKPRYAHNKRYIKDFANLFYKLELYKNNSYEE